MRNASPAIQTSRFLPFRRLIILVLAGLLIYYHTFTLYDLYLGAGTSARTGFEYIQSALRVVITLSLLLVVFGRRLALWGMWAGIAGLIATHYWAHFGNLPVDFTEGRHPLSYLKGIIFPTIITLAFQKTKGRSDVQTYLEPTQESARAVPGENRRQAAVLRERRFVPDWARRRALGCGDAGTAVRSRTAALEDSRLLPLVEGAW